ncbi:MAG: TonB-dependent receptor plug domain-containing protein, partial [Parvibaculaceae bacterium]|nr:TonB-dependent receptor plug domain-containing protein [Parvibaculaceae bacterium]
MSIARPILAASLVCGSMVMAQSAPAEEPVEPRASEVSQVAPPIEVTRLNAITVSAEKTDRLLKYTASSVVVADEKQLTQQGITSANELLDRIPNIVSVEPGNDAPTVRGIDGTGPAVGANAFFAGTRPRFSYQVDGRTLGFNEAVFQNSSVWDVDQVEIYRGPQSTLQGRNAIAGTMAIRTADPTFEWEARGRTIAGGQHTRIVSGAVSGPLVEDVLAFRLAADHQTHDSDIAFTAYPEEADPGLYRTTTLRGKLLFTPTNDVRSLLTFSHLNARAPQAEYVGVPFADQTA